MQLIQRSRNLKSCHNFPPIHHFEIKIVKTDLSVSEHAMNNLSLAAARYSLVLIQDSLRCINKVSRKSAFSQLKKLNGKMYFVEDTNRPYIA